MLENIYREQKIVQGTVPAADLYTDKLVAEIWEPWMPASLQYALRVMRP